MKPNTRMGYAIANPSYSWISPAT